MTAYVGSRANGSIERVNVLTGQTAQLSPATGEPAVGITLDDYGRLSVGDGPRGDARVLCPDARHLRRPGRAPLVAGVTLPIQPGSLIK